MLSKSAKVVCPLCSDESHYHHLSKPTHETSGDKDDKSDHSIHSNQCNPKFFCPPVEMEPETTRRNFLENLHLPLTKLARSLRIFLLDVYFSLTLCIYIFNVLIWGFVKMKVQ